MLDYRFQSLWWAPSVNIIIRRYLCWIIESSHLQLILLLDVYVGFCGGHLQLKSLFGDIYFGL